MELIITEKPSVARAIAAVLGAAEHRDGYLQGKGFWVSWCVGHLVELALPEAYDARYARWRYKDLPILPETWQYTVSAGTQKQFAVLASLMNDEHVTGIICATDAGREGELIFRLVYQCAKCRKPVRRLWISSMEESAIREGFRNLKPMAAYDNLYQAALCRAQADWLIGMNATRLYSLLYGPTLHVGRVMSPTLSMLAQREEAISAFRPETFYKVALDTGCGVVAESERFADLNEARRLMDACNHSPAVVKSIERRQKRENPPALYDLTSLQRDANRLYGFTAQQTLEYAQGLYEKRLLTYPRSDSRFLPHELEPELAELAARVCGALPFANGLELAMHTQQVIRDSEVTDHHALIPTSTMPGQDGAVRALTTGERDLLFLVCTRLLCALDDACIEEETVMHIECAGHDFTAKGKRMVQMGFKRFGSAFRGSLGNRLVEEREEHPLPLPEGIGEGYECPFPKASISEGQTTPPAHHTEGTLLHAMETAGKEDIPEDAEHKGIGTPATRASILEKLIETRLIERVGDRRRKVLLPTAKGKALAAVLPETLCSALLTAQWEQRLKDIEQGREKPEQFMRDIRQFVSELTRSTKRVEQAERLFPPLREKIGTCPKCGAAITERAKGFMCENRTCDFALWKNGGVLANAQKPLTSGEVRTLLEKGEVSKTGLRSAKTHTLYNATLHLDYTQGGKPILRPTFD